MNRRRGPDIDELIRRRQDELRRLLDGEPPPRSALLDATIAGLAAFVAMMLAWWFLGR